MSTPAAAEELGAFELKGKAAYERICAACHGPTGEGAKGPRLAVADYIESQVVAIVRSGQGEMPALPAVVISDDDILATIAYLTAVQAE